jgi:hypothetical protein
MNRGLNHHWLLYKMHGSLIGIYQEMTWWFSDLQGWIKLVSLGDGATSFTLSVGNY